VRLFRDANANGVLDAGDEQLGPDQTFSTDDGTAAFSGLNEQIATGSTIHAILVYDFAAGASPGGAFMAEIAANADVTATGGDSNLVLVPSGAPVVGNAVIVGAATPTPTPAATPAPTSTPSPTGGAFVCTGISAVVDPANPTHGHVFDGGECNQSMAVLTFRILSGSTYTSFTIPMPLGEFTSTSQPNDTIRGTNPDPGGNPKKKIAGAQFTTAGPNPHTIRVTAQSGDGEIFEDTLVVFGE
jgi:hypothetical protein